MSIDEQPMNVYWSGKRTETSNNFKTNYKGSVATKNNLPSSGNKKGDMYNVAESGENFIWNGSSWDNLSGDTLKTLNWQKSEKAGVVTIYPVSETMLEPVVDFMFTETPPANGDKGLENPSTFTGVNSVKIARCGKNIASIQNNSFTQYGITFTPLPNGGYRISGTTNGVNNVHFVLGEFLYKSGITYTASITSAASNSNVFFTGHDSNVLFNIYTGNNVTVTNNGIDRLLTLRISVIKDAGSIDLVVYPQIELGTSATSFELYEGENYTINLNGTYYGGSLNLASGLMMVTHAGYIFNGTEVFGDRDSSTYYRYRLEPVIPIPFSGVSHQVCSHFTAESNLNTTSQHFVIASDGTLHFITTQTTLTAFTDWIASQYQSGTPLTVIYKLASPYIVQLDPLFISSLTQQDKYTPKPNIIFTNTSAVQIGYAKSPIRSEYELTQAITAIE